MKKFLVLTCFAFLTSIIAKAADSTFIINGKFDKVKTGLIYLYIFGDGTKKDSAKIIDGTFSFKGHIQTPAPAMLDLKDEKQDYFRFYIEPAKISITGTGDSLGL